MAGAIVFVILFALYWLPSIWSYRVKHPSRAQILLINLFLGWTFIGWVVALVWASKVPLVKS